MTETLKEKTSKRVAILVGASAFVAMTIGVGLERALELRLALLQLGAAAVSTTIVTWFSTMVAADLKHRLVFFRLKNPLPGHRFYELVKRDPRINLDAVHRLAPALGLGESSPEYQNRLWYNELYKPVEDQPSVQESHRAFLAFRDAASVITVLLLVSLLALGWGIIAKTPTIAPWSVGILALETLALIVAARNAGNRFVVNTVAVAAQAEATSAARVVGDR